MGLILAAVLIILAQVTWSEYKQFRESEGERRFRFEVRAMLEQIKNPHLLASMTNGELKEWRQEIKECDSH